MRQRCTRCVGYLSGRTRQAMNKDARVHEAKLCICSAWFHVHLPPHWTKERCVGVMYATPCVFFRSCKRLVDTNTREMHRRLYFWICCSQLCFSENSSSKDLVGMDPKMLAIILFHCYFFSFEREIYFKKIFFIVLHFFPFQKSLNKAKIKLHNITKRYLTIYSRWSLKVDMCLLCMSCNFFWSSSLALVYL